MIGAFPGLALPIVRQLLWRYGGEQDGGILHSEKPWPNAPQTNSITAREISPCAK